MVLPGARLAQLLCSTDLVQKQIKVISDQVCSFLLIQVVLTDVKVLVDEILNFISFHFISLNICIFKALFTSIETLLHICFFKLFFFCILSFMDFLIREVTDFLSNKHFECLSSLSP